MSKNFNYSVFHLDNSALRLSKNYNECMLQLMMIIFGSHMCTQPLPYSPWLCKSTYLVFKESRILRAGNYKIIYAIQVPLGLAAWFNKSGRLQFMQFSTAMVKNVSKYTGSVYFFFKGWKLCNSSCQITCNNGQDQR